MIGVTQSLTSQATHGITKVCLSVMCICIVCMLTALLLTALVLGDRHAAGARFHTGTGDPSPSYHAV